MAQSNEEVIVERMPGKGGAIGLLTLNRPSALNAINHHMIQVLYTALKDWSLDDDIKAVIIRGAGDRAFCAGGDLRHTYTLHKQGSSGLSDFFRDEYALNALIFHYPKPYVALLDGITMGGGVGISLHGSHRVGSERLIFSMPETGIGLFPDVGGTYFLPRLPNNIGYYLGLTGARLNIDDCALLNLVTHIVPSSHIPDCIRLLCDTPLGKDPHLAVSETLATLARKPQQTQLSFASHEMELARIFSLSSMEDMMAELANASSQVSFYQETMNTLLRKSPSSLKVTLAALRRGQHFTFDECLEQEFTLVQHFLMHSDFFEGIRALLIDKDQMPHWRPATLASVNDADVARYFIKVDSYGTCKI